MGACERICEFHDVRGYSYALPIASFLTISRRAHRARHVARHRATLMFCRRKNIAKDLEK